MILKRQELIEFCEIEGDVSHDIYECMKCKHFSSRYGRCADKPCRGKPPQEESKKVEPRNKCYECPYKGSNCFICYVDIMKVHKERWKRNKDETKEEWHG